VQDLDVDRFWAARSAMAPEPDWSGRVSARLGVSGHVGAPRIALQGDAYELRLPQVHAESVAFSMEFADSLLRVPKLEMRMAGATILADGSLPARINLGAGTRLLRQQPFEAHLRVPPSSFALVLQLIPLFEPAPQSVPAGNVEATLDVTGTLAAPDARGQLRVSGAGFTLKGMEEIYRDIDAEGVFAADSLRITSVRGRSGESGRISGHGTVYFDGFHLRDYRYSLQAETMPVHSVPQMVAELSGRVDMRAVRLWGGTRVPEFRGALLVHEALITQEFTGGGEAGVLESTDLPEWLADVTLDAPGKVWIKNSQADVELEGSVRVVRSTAEMDVAGIATIRRGNYSLYLERFEITRGELDFSRSPGFTPDLDIEARQGPPGNRIYVYLTGRPPDELRWSLSSDRGDTSDELQQILFAGVRNDPFNVTSTVVERIVQDLQFIESFSIDQAAVDSTSASSMPFNISAGKALSDRVFVIYTLGVNESDIRDRVALEVDIVRGVLLATSYERRNIPDYQPNRPQNAFDVDLKFRWEY
jgi:translocation and assembly module TamB